MNQANSPQSRISKELERFELYYYRPLLSCLDVFPFLLLYIFLPFVISYWKACYDLLEFPWDLLGICYALIWLLNVLVWLGTHWSVDFHTFVKCSKVKEIKNATIVKAIPMPNKGKRELCPIENDNGQLCFTYQRRKFIYDEEIKKFRKLQFPLHNMFQEYSSSRGITTKPQLNSLRMKYGPNKFNIPMPSFGQLFKEQAFAPFFVFQVFCVLLWCLDEYWYYSIFTLIMLLIFEATVVKSRLQNLGYLRNMGLSARPIQVYRENKWITTETYDLVPGDLVSLSSTRNNGKLLSTYEELISPCDLLLLDGTCVVNEAMLTGESTPHVKESILNCEGTSVLNTKLNQLHLVFGGTKIIQQMPEKQHSIRTPDGGCLAYVLRTGFDTTQGKLMRMILFSTERVTANSKDSFLFIFFLLVFAIAASSYVWTKGSEDPSRSQYKLLLHCIMIITSVVPPELPLELSLAVNTSLLALHRLGIFCTEPFRIPFAGKIDICCFDKTGTLTSDNLVMKGVAEKSDCEKWDGKMISLTDPNAISDQSAFVLAGCHSLVNFEGKLIGDPMETAALSAIKWSFNKGDVATPKKGKKQLVRIIHRHHFSSELRRMSTIVSLDHEREARILALCKGAPEKVFEFLNKEKAPCNYDEGYKCFSRRGCRVLALAWKELDTQPTEKLKKLPRDQIEADLNFAGFVVFECPLKADAYEAIEIIRNSSHNVSMITGDHTLTACQVASTLNITTKPVLILSETETRKVWRSIDDQIEYSAENGILTLKDSFDFCISGPLFNSFINHPQLRRHLYDIRVFARVSPDQKEIILSTLKDIGFVTLMCGDGTNDVGALKQAHVGIALLNEVFSGTMTSSGVSNNTMNNPQPRSEISSVSIASNAPSNRKSNINNNNKKTSSNAKSVGESDHGQKSSISKSPLSSIHSQERMTSLMKQLEESGMPMLQFGDASIASPFTCKSTAVVPVTFIIRQGRCTLVTTFQMFKILALNCLISAYSLSVLYLDGVKFADTQATVAGIMIALCFLFISRSKPLNRLSKERPESNLFSPYMILSILGQFFIHLYCLVTLLYAAKQYSNSDKKIDPDSDFKPNLVNSAVFIISLMMQISTFAINYKGHPFMESLLENRPLFFSLSIVAGMTLFMAAEIDSSFNEWIELVPFTDEFRTILLKTIFFDFAGSWLVENGLHLLLGRRRSNDR